MREAELSIDEVQQDIRAIFEQCRQSPGGPFKSQGFLNFLLDPPSNAISDSWKGQNRKVSFFKKVEAHFLISFPSKAWDRNWAFDQFCDWVADRARKPEVNLKMANKQLSENVGCLAQLFIVITFFGLMAWLTGGIGPIGTLGFIVIPAILALVTTPEYLHNRRIVSRLRRLT